MTLLIAGGGIGGLALGLMLEQAGIRFRIFEANHTLRMPGLGLLLRPEAVGVLTELGLGASLAMIGVPMTEVAGVSADGIVTETAPCGRAAGAEMPQLSVHRGRLHRLMADALCRRAGDDRIVLSAALGNFADDGDRVVAHFEDRRTGRPKGSTRGRALVAADGIRSAGRARLFPREPAARWGGINVWRGIGPGPAPRGGHATVVVGGPDRRITLSPIRSLAGEGPMLNWVAKVSAHGAPILDQPHWVSAGRIAELAAGFEDWRFDWLDIGAVIRGTEDVYEHPLLVREPLPGWARGRVALLGDAAHASLKLGSGGASDAILDAAALARCLQTFPTVAEAFRAYEAERREALATGGRGSMLGAEALPAAGRLGWSDVLAEAERLAAQRAPQGPVRLPPALESEEGIEASLAVARIVTFRGG